MFAHRESKVKRLVKRGGKLRGEKSEMLELGREVIEEDQRLQAFQLVIEERLLRAARGRPIGPLLLPGMCV